MSTYLYCTNCKSLTLSRYNFEILSWECQVCGKKTVKPEDKNWKKKVKGERETHITGI